MSTRDFMIAVKSVQAIRDVVASGDEAVFKLMLKATTKHLKEEYEDEELDEQLLNAEKDLRQMVLTEPPLAREPGCWIYFIERLVESKRWAVKVDLDDFDQGYKHYYAWEPYQKLVQERLTASALQSLDHLRQGRPLRGQKVDHDSCLFAWLTHPEIAGLHDSLTLIATKDVGHADLEEFHQNLVIALARLKAKKCDLVLGAS